MSQPAKPHILIVDNSVAVTGALHAILQDARDLDSRFRFSFVLPAGSAAVPKLQAQGFAVHELPFVEISKRPLKLLQYIPVLALNGQRLAHLVKQEKIDLLHFNDLYNLTGLTGRLLGAGIPQVTHVRFMPHRFGALARLWAALHLRFSDRIICVSQAVKTFFTTETAKVVVIADPLPAAERHPAKVIRDEPPGVVRLLYLSNYIQGKGQDYALQAFAKAYTQNRQLRLIFRGGDMGLDKNRAFKESLQQQTAALGLQDVVRFEGFVTDVEAEIKAADVLLNFSESESFSLTCLDALYFGTPLIATDCGGPAELFENGHSGLLVPNKDVEAMTRAMLELAGSREKQQRFAEAGRSYVRQKFNSSQTSGKLGQLYAEVLQERGKA